MGKMRGLRFPVLVLLLGIVFLLAVSSIGVAYGEKDVKRHSVLIKNPERPDEEQPGRLHPEREEEEQQQPRQRHQEQEQQEKKEQGRRGRSQEQEEEREKEGEWRGRRRHQDPEERERVREREEREREREERERGREEREERERRREERQSGSGSRRQRNPYHFTSNKFQTRYRNRNGQIRVLERFDERSNRLENLQNYRIVEFQSKPNTLILPHHSDAEYILVVLNGRATITVVNSDKRQAYNLESGDAFRLPAATTSYILNPDDNQNLRLVKLAIPVNNPGKFDDFFPSNTQDQQSYFRGFSRNTLEATFNARYEEIERILLGDEEEEEEEQGGGQEERPQDEGVIVRVSKEQIQELSKHAQSSSASKRGGKPSEYGPFNLRSNKPIYSNKFGNLYEITPNDDRNPQLQDLEISLTLTQINEGGLFLPHYNSKSIYVVVVDEGEGNYEMVGLREQQRQQEEEEVRRYRAQLSEGDIFVIPAGYPFSINASSNLRLLGFGINADQNQRNFLAGSEDNVIRQLDREVKELTFPGSGEDVERLIKKQQQSYFANAQPQKQQQEERRGRRGPISSILSAL